MKVKQYISGKEKKLTAKLKECRNQRKDERPMPLKKKVEMLGKSTRWIQKYRTYLEEIPKEHLENDMSPFELFQQQQILHWMDIDYESLSTTISKIVSTPTRRYLFSNLSPTLLKIVIEELKNQ